MKQTLLIIMVLLSSLLFSQQREVVVDRYFNGTKELIIVYEGEGINESLVRKLEYYENEKIKSSTDWKDGKPNGDFIEWYENEQKYSEGTFKDGEEVGKWTYWYENGQKEYEVTHKDGEMIEEIYWDENGNVIEDEY